MEVLAINILLCVFLGIIGFQDFKYRAIHFLLVILVFAAGVSLLIFNAVPIAIFAVTLLFITLMVTLLWLYLSAKNGRWINPFKKYIGLGDVLFFFAVTPLFAVQNYLFFFTTGMVVALFLALLYFRKKHQASIPLAGILAFYLIGLKGFAWVLQKDIFYTFNYF
ncbi:MAG: hypothetical protein KTR22_08000 [Flavobacteriaceae bacterium]|nr:hypothetical protein [Flavobacteriaceae bacterium]